MRHLLVLKTVALTLLLPSGAFAQSDPGAEATALPKAPEGFEIKCFAKESLVRQPYSMAFDRLLSPIHVADIAAFLITQRAKPADVTAAVMETPKPSTQRLDGDQPEPEAMKPKVAANSKFGLDLKADRLIMTHADKPLGEYVFRDPKILRPYFANLHGLTGTKITRNHPPIPGKDATDHDTMHPGIWLGFGDINGVDFWRNKGAIKHVRFVTPPTATKDQITFATECQLRMPNGKPLADLIYRFSLSRRPAGWLLIWDATFHAGERDITFGDQEEMGFGARLATDCIEKNGGVLLNSHGKKTAQLTWGQPAEWCDYSGKKDAQRVGITLMAAPKNFRESWWHNRDYGVFVANPFGRASMRQGAISQVIVKPGESFHLIFGAVLHDGIEFDPSQEYQHFLKLIQP